MCSYQVALEKQGTPSKAHNNYNLLVRDTYLPNYMALYSRMCSYARLQSSICKTIYNLHIPCHKFLKPCMESKAYFAQASSNTAIIIIIIINNNTISFYFCNKHCLGNLHVLPILNLSGTVHDRCSTALFVIAYTCSHIMHGNIYLHLALYKISHAQL
jgi:hypothetical protein